MIRPAASANRKLLRDVLRAERLLARIDRLPGPANARAIGTPEAQAAIALIAKARAAR